MSTSRSPFFTNDPLSTTHLILGAPRLPVLTSHLTSRFSLASKRAAFDDLNWRSLYSTLAVTRSARETGPRKKKYQTPPRDCNHGCDCQAHQQKEATIAASPGRRHAARLRQCCRSNRTGWRHAGLLAWVGDGLLGDVTGTGDCNVIDADSSVVGSFTIMGCCPNGTRDFRGSGRFDGWNWATGEVGNCRQEKQVAVFCVGPKYLVPPACVNLTPSRAPIASRIIPTFRSNCERERSLSKVVSAEMIFSAAP